MNEEIMEVMLEESWGDEGGAGEEVAVEEAVPEVEAVPAKEETSESSLPKSERLERISIPRGVPGREHPLLTRARERAQAQDLQRFMQAFPGVKGESIPQEVWTQVAHGVPLVSAYTMYENHQLKMQLDAERQNNINRSRTTGRLGANSGMELDELDRMWSEED